MTNPHEEKAAAEMASSRRWGTLLAIGVGVLLLVPWVVGPPSGTAASRQNRPVAQFPALTAKSLADVGFFAGVDTAVADRLRAKPTAVAAVNELVLGATGRSASPKVIADEQDRGLPESSQLYFAGEFTEPCSHARDPQWAAAGAARLRDAAEVGGKDVLFVVVPNKSTTLPITGGHYGRALMKCARDSRDQLTALADEPESPVSLVNPDLVIASDPREPYWPGDTHWTPTGGLSLVTELVEEFGGDTVGLQGRFTDRDSTLTNRDDLLALLGIEHRTTSAWPQPASGQPTFEDVPDVTPYVPTHFVSTDPIPGMPKRVLIIYDSFVYAPRIQTALASVFAEGWFLQWDAIADVGALPQVDAVILESAERVAGGRLSGFYEGSPFQPLLDYLVSPASSPGEAQRVG